MATRRMPEFDNMTPSKKKAKSVFNRPMREVKKPAKKIPVKKKPSPVQEQPFVSLFLSELEAAINRIAAIFGK